VPREPRVLSRLGLLGLSMVVVACGSRSSTSEPLSAPTVAAAPATRPTSAPTVTSPSSATPSSDASVNLRVREFDVVAGSHPHDVAPAPDGGVWYTGQHDGTLGYLDPATGDVRTIPLGAGSAPHGVITGPDGNAWITPKRPGRLFYGLSWIDSVEVSDGAVEAQS
jgi:streptogramin lyase